MAQLSVLAVAAASFFASQVTAQSMTGSSSGTATGASAANTNSVTSTTQSVFTTTINGTQTTYGPQFTVPASADEGGNIIPNIYDSEAVNAQVVCPGYTASNAVNMANGFSASLALAGNPCNVYGFDVDYLNLTVQYQSNNRLSVEITPAYLDSSNYTLYMLDPNLVSKPAADAGDNATADNSDLVFAWTNTPSFNFNVTRKSTGDLIFDTSGSVLVFEDQFVEFATQMPENYNIYGLGETIHALRIGNNYTQTMWAADDGNPVDGNLYGQHPFYLDTRYYEVDQSGNMTLLTGNASNSANYTSYSHGVYNRNAHGLEILMRETNVTWRALGGNIDLYFFDGPDQPKVTSQYLNGAAGLPAMQQYWTFGYHQCRWGYENWTVLQEVVDNFKKFDIPLETIWTDIDWMKEYRDFENDPIRFNYSEGKTFLDGLTAAGQHYVPIVDSALYIPSPNNDSDAYMPYTRGHDLDVFIHNADGSEYIGSVWPGYTVFPDWHSSNAQEWWTNEMMMWHDMVDWSGIWLDMSEASSFCIGSCGSGNLSLNPVHPPFLLPGQPGNQLFFYPEDFNVTNATEASSASSASASQASAYPPASSTSEPYLRTSPTPGVRNVTYPPYTMNNDNGALVVHGLSPDAVHADGYQDYAVHSTFGHQIINATYHALTQVFPNKRPFIIGRSTFVGSGKWGGHWGGDNISRWAYMYFSIPQALSFSLFGIPMFGVDTCGFSNDSDEELCNRWMQVSAFYPFYRNHNVLSAPSQEPYVWSSVIEATKTAMNIRYSILPYMYTLFYNANTYGDTVMRFMAWEFPNEPYLANADRQFMLGGALMITPVLTPQMTTVDGVFPGYTTNTIWYDWYTQSAMDVQPMQNVTIDAPLGHIPVYVRGGYVIPMQEPGYTTSASRMNPWSVLVALDSQGCAAGELYVDDGESITPNATLLVDFWVGGNSSLVASMSGSYKDTNALANVTVLGVQNSVSNVTLNGMSISSGWNYNSTSKVLSITGLNNATSAGAWSAAWQLNWG